MAGDGGGFEDSDKGEIAVVFEVIESVTDDKFRSDGEAEMVGFEGNGAGDFLAEEDAGCDARDAGFRKNTITDRGEGEAAVKNIIEENHPAVAEIRQMGLAEGDLSGRAGAVVTGDREAINLDRQGDAAEEIGEEDNAAIEERQKSHALDRTGAGGNPAEFAGQFVSEFVQACVDLLFGEEDAVDIIEEGISGWWRIHFLPRDQVTSLTLPMPEMTG